MRWKRIEANSDEPLFEFISPDSTVIRLNLRPYKAGSGDPEVLFAAMQKTWESVVPSTILFESYWEDLGKSTAPYTPEALQNICHTLLARGTSRHSPFGGIRDGLQAGLPGFITEAMLRSGSRLIQAFFRSCLGLTFTLSARSVGGF